MHTLSLPCLNPLKKQKMLHYHGFLRAMTKVNWAILFLLLSACATHPHFIYPVEKPHTLSRHFSLYHEGIDFPKRTGQAVWATADGKVVYAGQRLSSYGKVIIIEHKNKWASLYAHLHTIKVQNGHFVRQKQKIGEVGNTGRSSGPHLHFELMYDKQPLNPLPYLK